MQYDHQALKEANETGYWLELLLKTSYIDEIKFQDLDNTCSQIRVMLIKSTNTVKASQAGNDSPC